MSASMKRWRRHALVADRGAHLVEIAPVAGGEIVEADDRLVELEQRLDQVRADEAGAAGHEPAQRLRRQLAARTSSSAVIGSARLTAATR